jgi:DNA-binding CsgD family transcriptional regulator
MATISTPATAATPHDWVSEYERFAAADQQAPLSAEDLERWAVAAHLLGEDDQVVALRDRAYRQYLDRGLTEQAARCVFWIGFHLGNAGQQAQAAGWLARLRRLIESTDRDPHLAAMVRLADAVNLMQTGRAIIALPMCDEVAEAAQAADDDDLFALAVLSRAGCLHELGRSSEALAALDETMVLVVADLVAPQIVGLAYCSMIGLCMERFDVQRAGEWTRALSGWCDAQTGLVPYRGVCQVHRAEIFQLRGAWTEAASQAVHVSELPQSDGWIAGAAHYRLAELHRLGGRFDLAERSYAAAGARGQEVQPGLGLLRAAQGNPAAAMASLERALAEHGDLSGRAPLLAAVVEVALATGDVAAARSASVELSRGAAEIGTPYLTALAAHAGGLVALADDDPRAGLPLLRRAWTLWQQVDAPYEAAKTRVQVGVACRALGDEDAARMEVDAARTVFEQLGATFDISTLASFDDTAAQRGPLSARECEVLALVAQGHTNRAIAAKLFLSEKTVARHLSNIFGKLGVNSRSAATGYAYEHGLV